MRWESRAHLPPFLTSLPSLLASFKGLLSFFPFAPLALMRRDQCNNGREKRRKRSHPMQASPSFSLFFVTLLLPYLSGWREATWDHGPWVLQIANIFKKSSALLCLESTVVRSYNLLMVNKCPCPCSSFIGQCCCDLGKETSYILLSSSFSLSFFLCCP